MTSTTTPLGELKRQAEELQASIVRAEQASAQRDSYIHHLEQQIIDLKRQLAEQEASDELADELERARAEHQHLRDRIRSPRFWTEEFVRPFAMDVQNLTALQRELAVDHPEELTEVIQRWQQELSDGLTALANGSHDEQRAERLRHLLLVQWVLLQWLSVTRATESL